MAGVRNLKKVQNRLKRFTADAEKASLELAKKFMIEVLRGTTITYPPRRTGRYVNGWIIGIDSPEQSPDATEPNEAVFSSNFGRIQKVDENVQKIYITNNVRHAEFVEFGNTRGMVAQRVLGRSIMDAKTRFPDLIEEVRLGS